MLTHIRQDIAIRALPGWLVVGPFLTLILALLVPIYWSILHRFGLLPVPVLASWVSWLPWLPPAIYLAYAQGRRRARDLDLALPLPARRLWLAHGLSLSLGAAAILMLSATLMAFYSADYKPGTGVGIMVATLRLAAGLVIAVAVLESRESALVRLTPSLTNYLLVAAVLTAVPVLVLRLPGDWVIVLLGLALVLGFRTWRSLPAALTLEPAEVPSEEGKRDYPGRPAGAGASKIRPDAARPDAARPDAARPDAARPDAARPQGASETRTIPEWNVAPTRGSIFGQIQSASRLHRIVLYYLLYPTLALFGMCSSGLVVGGYGEAVMFSVPLLAVFLLMLTAQVTSSQLVMLDPLPVSRRLLFAAMVIPAFAAWLLGYGIVLVLTHGWSEASRAAAQGMIPTGIILAIVLILTGVLWFCLIALSLRFPHHRYTLGMSHFYALIAALVAFELLLGLAIRLGWLTRDAPTVFIRRLAAALPTGEATLALLCLLLLGAGYVLAEAQFRRFEVAPRGDEPETMGGI